MKKKPLKGLDLNWTISSEITLSNGNTVSKDDVIRIDGEPGQRFVFVEHVINHDNNAEWITVHAIHKGQVGMFRSFRPHRIRTIGKKKRPQMRPAASGNAKEIRQWAQENNIEVPAMGRIPGEVRDKYIAATSQK